MLQEIEITLADVVERYRHHDSHGESNNGSPMSPPASSTHIEQEAGSDIDDEILPLATDSESDEGWYVYDTAGEDSDSDE